MRQFKSFALASCTIGFASIAGIISLIAISGPAQAEMRLSSQDFEEGATLDMAQVYDGFGCTGENISPQLSWDGAPEGTKSFIINVYDPDAPTGSGWWHWSLVNIPADTHSLPTGAGSGKAELPHGVIQGRNDYGYSGFGGACPPEGDKPHRYIFTVFAMPMETVPLDQDASGALVGYYAETQSLDRARITGFYAR